MLLQKIHKLRTLLLLIVILAGVFLWKPLQQALVVNNSLRIWFKEDAPALKQYDDFQRRFGSDEVIIILFSDERGVLQKANIDKIKALTARIEAHPDVALVLSISNMKMLQKEGIGLIASDLLDARLSEQERREKLDRVPLLSRHLINEDFTATRLIVQFKRLPDMDARRGQIIQAVKEVAYQEIAREQLAFGGVGVIFEGLNELSQQDFGLFLAIAYGVMCVVLVYLYRSFLILILALGVIALATYFTLGLYGLAGHELNLMSTLIPIILVLLGMIDVIHIVNERMHLQSHAINAREKALTALKNVWKPCLFTTLTTMAGFLSLLFTPMSILREFGLFSALGILLCLIFTYLLSLLMLPLLKDIRSRNFPMASLWHDVIQYKKVLLIATLVLCLISVVGMFQVKVDTYTLGYLPQDHPVVKDHVLITQKWGDYMPLELMLDISENYSIHSPEVVQRSLRLMDTLKSMEGISAGFGFSSLTQAGLQAQYGDKADKALQSKSAVLQMQRVLRRYYPALYTHLVDSTGQYARITLFGKMSSAATLKDKMDTLMALSAGTMDSLATVIPSGYLPMYADIINYVTQSQVKSLALAIIFIFLLVWIFIRDVQLALVALLTNMFPLMILFGWIGWLHIDLDIATASIAAIGLSFCIDDSIHFIYDYKKNRLTGMNSYEAQAQTFRKIGPALVTSSLILFCGYILMVFASLKTIHLFGSLTALMVIAALYAQLVIFPLLIQKLDTGSR